MFMLAAMQEPLAYLGRVQFDMCVAGDLKDPQNKMPIRKSLQTLTSSEGVMRSLQDRQCRGLHEQHQPLEGRTRVDGLIMNRTAFSQRYPRKFARQVAKIMSHTWERPVLTSEALAVGYGKRHTRQEETEPRRVRRRYEQAPPPEIQELSEWQIVKRRRKEQKQPATPEWSHWQQAFQSLESIVPRVGRLEVREHESSAVWQQQFPDMEIKSIVACRGTDRMLSIPEHLRLEPQLHRRLVFIDRHDGILKGEDQWEQVAGRPKTQIIRKGPACRLGVTAFATPMTLRTPLPQQSGTSETSEEAVRTEPVQDSRIPENNQEEEDNSNLEHLSSLSPEERSSLLRAHKNLGHPEPAKLAALLRQQGFRPDIVKSAYELRCDTCESLRAPQKARPSAIREAIDFNDKISVDGMTWTNPNGYQFHIYHFIDHATNFHVACVAPERTTEGFLEKFCERWLSWAGAPGQMLVDSGTEFNSEQFGAFCQEHSVRCIVTSQEAAWQNAKCERHGGILKHMLDKFHVEHPILYNLSRLGYSPRHVHTGKECYGVERWLLTRSPRVR